MRITVNGQQREVAEDATLADVLRHLEINPRVTAALRNGAVVQRGDYETQRLQTGDRLEIVTMVGGG